MASIVETLTASGGTESAGFLNDIIAQLWPNINVAGCRMVKEMVEPMLASMLPGPLSSLHFVKLDLGPVPLRISRVDVLRTEQGGIKLDMDVDWEGKCDIDLDGTMVPKLGVERVRLRGRMSVLLAPLTNIIPLIGAAQVAFINPPDLKLDFTGAADIADCAIIDKTVRKTIQGIIASMAVLPNRYLVKLDGNCDFFKAYLPHIGILRLTVEKGTNCDVPRKSESSASGKLSGLLSKVGLRDVPDCYANVTVGAEPVFRTKTIEDSKNPEWHETHDFLVADMDQNIVIDVDDADPGSNDDIGTAIISIKKLMLGGGQQELPLLHKGEPVQDASVSIRGQFFSLVNDAGALRATEESGEGQVVGLATVLIASALNLQGQRDELKPNVKVTFGTDAKNAFNTATKTYSPGTDIFNPMFDQSFCIPITRDLVANPPGFEITMMNGKEERVGSVELPFEEVLNAEGCLKEGEFDVGGGVRIKAQVSVRTLQKLE